MTKQVPTVMVNQEDLFRAILRVFMLIEDADPFNSSDVTFTADPDSAMIGEDDTSGSDLVTDDASAAGNDEVLDPYPTHFADLYYAHDNFAANMLNEFNALFVLLSAPLEKDPVLKEKFQEYALEHYGSEIEFCVIRPPVLPKGPKLFILPPEDDKVPDPADPSPPKNK